MSVAHRKKIDPNLKELHCILVTANIIGQNQCQFCWMCFLEHTYVLHTPKLFFHQYLIKNFQFNKDGTES